MPQQAFQFLDTGFPAGAVPHASLYPVITHLTKMIDMAFFPFSASSLLDLFVFHGKAPPSLGSCQISEHTHTCTSQTHLHTHERNRY